MLRLMRKRGGGGRGQKEGEEGAGVGGVEGKDRETSEEGKEEKLPNHTHSSHPLITARSSCLTYSTLLVYPLLGPLLSHHGQVLEHCSSHVIHTSYNRYIMS